MKFTDVLAYVGLPLLALGFVYAIVANIFRMRLEIKWGGPETRVNGLRHHLRTIGISTSVLGNRRSMWGLNRIRGQPHEFWEAVRAIIKLENRDIDSINVVTHESWYYLDFIVRNSSPHERTRSSKTRLVMKRSPSGRLLTFIHIWSVKVVDVEWRGDADLARELNFDDRLRDRLLNADLGDLHHLEIVPEPKYGCTRIRTYYFLPTPELFDILETIAKHIKSV